MADPIVLPSILKSLAAPAGTNPADVQSARDQATVQFAPQESSITNVINTLQGHLASDTAAQQQYGNIADQKISDIGNQLKDQLQGNVGAIGNIFQQGVGKVGAGYDEAANTLQGIGSSVQNRLTQGAQKLGQTQALGVDPYGTDPMSRLQSSLATMQGRNATSKASSVGNLATLGASLQGIAQKAVGDSEREYGQKRADVATQVLKTIGQLQTTANTGITEQLQKFSDLATTMGPAFRQLLNQATSSRTGAERQTALDAFDQAIKMGNLSVAQQNADTNAAAKTAAADPNSLDNIIKGQTIAKNERDLNPTNAYISSTEGNANLMDYINQLRGSGHLKGPAYAGIQNFINQNVQTASALNQDPYKYLIAMAQSKTGQGNMVQLPKTSGSKYPESDYRVPLDVLLGALDQRYKGVGSANKIGTRIK